MNTVARVNGITNKNQIKVGQRLFIPGATRVLKVDVYIEDVTARRKTQSVGYTRGSFVWPVRGKVTRKFGHKGATRSEGIDISAPRGTPIRAARSGKVVYSDDEMKGYGNLVILEHKGAYFTIYGHNQVNMVKENMVVAQGQIIGKVGDTGTVTSPRLHFEIRKGSKALDPLRFLP
jgi:lipoprotein NlpD